MSNWQQKNYISNLEQALNASEYNEVGLLFLVVQLTAKIFPVDSAKNLFSY